MFIQPECEHCTLHIEILLDFDVLCSYVKTVNYVLKQAKFCMGHLCEKRTVNYVV
jgi:hypothetical protein